MASQLAPTPSETTESLVSCQNSQGVELRATLLKLSRFQVAFEVYSPPGTLQTSEVLSDFRIMIQGQPVYSGRAVVSNLINVGTVLVCEATLDEACLDLNWACPLHDRAKLRAGFEKFMDEWGRSFKVHPEFKLVIADMQSFLADLRLWLEQLELQIRAAPSGDRLEMERSTVREVAEAVIPMFDALHERMEDLSGKIEPELRPAHGNFMKRLIHPLMLCSPFGYRTYQKPLGYAGDYEMVNMIVRDPIEGSSLFAKVVNCWFLRQWPARAHRHRIGYLKERLKEESLRGATRGRPIRVLNLGCGPAREIQEFLAEEALSDHAQFTLLDFNQETIEHATEALEAAKKRYGRQTSIQIQKKSVQQVLKDGAKGWTDVPEKKYDLVYCAGLFDYLPDRTCRQLMNIFYDWLAPGGLVAATNVDDCKPFRHMLEFVLDWHLIYRNTQKGAALLPDRAPADSRITKRDPTTVNLFLEARKPNA